MRRSLLGREGRQWTEKAYQNGLPANAKKRNWTHSIYGEFIRIVKEIKSQDGISRSWK